MLALPDPEEPVTHIWAEGADRVLLRFGWPRSTPAGYGRCCGNAVVPVRFGRSGAVQR